MTNASNRFFHSRSATRLRTELTLIGVLALCIVAFRLEFNLPERDAAIPLPRVQETIEMEDILPTVHPTRVPIIGLPAPDLFVEVPDDDVITDAPEPTDASLEAAAVRPDSLRGVRVVPPPPPPPAPAAAPPAGDEAEIFVVVEEMPEMEGGTARLYSLLRYPELARKAGVEGRVVVEVTIERDGKPADPRVVRSANPMLDEAAIEAVMKLTFKPGKQRGKAVRVRYTIPIRFRLNA